MTSLATFVLSQIMAVTLCTVPVAVVLPDENALLQEIGEIFVEAIREPFGKDAPEAVRDAVLKFNERLQAYGDASAAWIVKSCELTDAQQLKLKEIVDGQLVPATAQFARSKDANDQDQMVPDTMPLLFTLPNGPGTDFTEQLIAAIRKDLLTEEQVQRLETALGEREAFRNKAYLSYIVAIVDSELFLTSSQREALHSELTSQKTTLYHPRYAFSPQPHYMPYESVLTILKAFEGKSFLDPSQQKRLEDLNGKQQKNHRLMIPSASGPEEWTRQISDAGQQQRDIFLRTAAVRNSYYENELQLSAEQVDHLRLAGKGAAAAALADWKEKAQQTTDRMKQQLGQLAGNAEFFSVALIDPNFLDQNEIWADAVASVTEGFTKEGLNQRQESHRTATAQALLAAYDSELWLAPDQRRPLGKMILQTLPTDSNQSAFSIHIRDLILLTYSLFKTTEKQRADVISESQQSVWKQMASCFHWQQQNNQVVIPLGNQGGSFNFTLTE